MSQIIPIFIPTYIGSVTYAPVRVLPRLLFYNGLIDCENYYIEGITAVGSSTTALASEIPAFPYFDNYNVVSGSFPTTDSLSLLFNNETAVYGTLPNQNLYTEYWEKYISLLYNPKTRLLNCSAIIPLADYFEMELNDVVNFRGNYYHLRAINDYSLKTGNCTLQLLGPIIADTFYVPPPPEYAYVSWSMDETNADANLKIFTNTTLKVDATADTSSNFSMILPQIVTASLSASGTWGNLGPTTMSLSVSGSGYTFTGVSTNYTTSVLTTFTASVDTTYTITATTQYNSGSPVNFSTTQSCYQNDGVVTLFNPTGGRGTYEFNSSAYFTEASALAATTGWINTGSITFNDMPDGTLWYGLRDGQYPANIIAKSVAVNCNTSSNECYETASFTVGISSASVYWVDCCGEVSSSSFGVGDHTITGCIKVGSISSPDSVGNPEYFGTLCTCTTPTAAGLEWSFSESGGATGNMDLYINDSIVESRSSTSSGAITVYEGDEIYVVISASACSSPNGKANAYTFDIIADASCEDGSTTLTTSTYTVTSGDIGNVLSLRTYAVCDTASV
jgi:hypothetical protein